MVFKILNTFKNTFKKALAMEKVKKTEEAKKISDAKYTEVVTQVEDLEQQLSFATAHMQEKDELYTEEVEAYRDELNSAKADWSEREDAYKAMETQVASLQELTEVQKDQILALEEEMRAEKTACEKQTAENMEEVVKMKVEVSAAQDKVNVSNGLVTTLKSEIEEVREMLEKVRKEKEEMEREIEEMKEDKRVREENVVRLNAVIGVLEKEKESKDEAILDLEKRLSDVSTDAEFSSLFKSIFKLKIFLNLIFNIEK